MTTIDVVTVFLYHNQKILIVQRGNQVRTFRGYWSGISGYLEPETNPVEQAKIEVREETGIKSENISKIFQGKTIEIIDPAKEKRIWRVHPFKFILKSSPEINLDWENQKFQWINPLELNKFKTVPGLKKAWESANNGKRIE